MKEFCKGFFIGFCQPLDLLTRLFWVTIFGLVLVVIASIKSSYQTLMQMWRDTINKCADDYKQLTKL